MRPLAPSHPSEDRTVRVKLVSDGVRSRVTNAETGEAIHGVVSATFAHDAGGGNEPTLTVTFVDFDAEVEGVVDATSVDSAAKAWARHFPDGSPV